ncbi:phage baseplate protein [Pectobacterium wasabiae]|uniref:Dit-like phage tail protein N-terminal domain-containing protein n=1 Tax=Pectobacterium wasabiae TaxID=55208 RepID=A0AAW3EGR9_9GAMM|nr:hypothetical protein [Pectobacterium wasabiae]AOR62293.1 hypothetical protein A7983_03220 [Pectobacterium wasabiae CFBP 3304]EJS92954.1 Phage conserved protein [Pectobacterium wasabiae CFBP 3304]KFX06337.1 hypothetical protein JV38_11490 [Pectobacterium wasabiae]KGA28172.1 hypothetical protein KU73_13055 [Pectobacterium wasabiae]
MAIGLSGYNISPMNYKGKDGIIFHLRNDMSVFLTMSATTDMQFSAPMDVTTQPVQSGQVITDNIQEKPQTITVNGVVVVDYEGTFFVSRNNSEVEDFVSTLQRWRSQRQILRVLCKDGITLDNALCTQFEAKKDSKIANGLNVSLTFQNANFVVQVGRTEAPANGGDGKKTTKDGAVTQKKDKGKTGTEVIAKPPAGLCDKLASADADGSLPDNAKKAFANCQIKKTVDPHTGKVTWGNGSAQAEKYIPNDWATAAGINPNKKL